MGSHLDLFCSGDIERQNRVDKLMLVEQVNPVRATKEDKNRKNSPCPGFSADKGGDI